MEFLVIRLTKDSSLLLHAIHSTFYWRILKKTKYRLLSGFQNPYIKSAKPRKLQGLRKSDTYDQRGRKRAMHSSSSPEIYSRICSAALFPVTSTPLSKFMQAVCGRGWGRGVELCWRPYSAGVLILYVTRLRTYEIAFPPLDKNLEGKRHHTDNQLPQSPFAGHF
jgi:hypothetical protein